MRTLVIRYPLWSFVILNCLISWAFLYPAYRIILQSEHIPPIAFLGLIGAYGPTLAAIIVQYLEDKDKLKDLLKKLIHVKFSSVVYMLIIAIPIGAYLLSQSTAMGFFGEAMVPDLSGGFAYIAVWFLLALPFGPMGEELGWRGFLLPRLLKKHSILWSTVVVGFAWGIWHLASFSFPGAAIPAFLPVNLGSISLFIVNTICLSFLYTYVFFRSGGSVFAAIILHAFLNASSNITNDFLGESSIFNVQLTAYVLSMVVVGFIGIVLLASGGYCQKREQTP